MLLRIGQIQTSARLEPNSNPNHEPDSGRTLTLTVLTLTLTLTLAIAASPEFEGPKGPLAHPKLLPP